MDAGRIAHITDPARRALAAGKEMEKVRQRYDDLVRIRAHAVGEMRAAGWSYGKIAEALSISRNRVVELAKAATAT